jgi:hypothetical protein
MTDEARLGKNTPGCGDELDGQRPSARFPSRRGGVRCRSGDPDRADLPAKVRPMDVGEPWRLRLEVRLWGGLTAAASLEGTCSAGGSSGASPLRRGSRPGRSRANLAPSARSKFAAVLVGLGWAGPKRGRRQRRLARWYPLHPEATSP